MHGLSLFTGVTAWIFPFATTSEKFHPASYAVNNMGSYDVFPWLIYGTCIHSSCCARRRFAFPYIALVYIFRRFNLQCTALNESRWISQSAVYFTKSKAVAVESDRKEMLQVTCSIFGCILIGYIYKSQDFSWCFLFHIIFISFGAVWSKTKISLGELHESAWWSV